MYIASKIDRFLLVQECQYRDVFPVRIMKSYTVTGIVSERFSDT